MDRAVIVAIVVGIVQGIFEWLPISSEGNVALALSLVGRSPTDAVAFALFLHLGTALSAAVYYRARLGRLFAALPAWRPRRAFDPDEAVGAGDASETIDTGVTASPTDVDDVTDANDARNDRRPVLSFLLVATVVSGVVGIAAFQTLEAIVSELTGGLFVAAIGGLLVLTGAFQRVSTGRESDQRTTPTLLDAVLVGVGQGLAILPGVSRSGTTAGVLLLRGYDGPRSFELSFLLSIPAALGAGVLAYAETGIDAVPPFAAGVALVVAAVVGYVTIDALMRLVERVDFWAVCVGLGGLALLGGALVV